MLHCPECKKETIPTIISESDEVRCHLPPNFLWKHGDSYDDVSFRFKNNIRHSTGLDAKTKLDLLYSTTERLTVAIAKCPLCSYSPILLAVEGLSKIAPNGEGTIRICDEQYENVWQLAPIYDSWRHLLDEDFGGIQFPSNVRVPEKYCRMFDACVRGIYIDYNLSVLQCRRILELALKERTKDNNRKLSQLIDVASGSLSLDESTVESMHRIRLAGNTSAHDNNVMCESSELLEKHNVPTDDSEMCYTASLINELSTCLDSIFQSQSP